MWVEVGDVFAIGEGGLDLLAAIASRQSIAKAARDVGWSYRHAWGYLRHAERALDVRLTRSLPGKGRARGTTLSSAGRRLVQQLTAVRQVVRHAATAAAVEFT